MADIIYANLKKKGYTFVISICDFWDEITAKAKINPEPLDEHFIFYNEKPEHLSLGRIEYGKGSLLDYLVHYPRDLLIAFVLFPITLWVIFVLLLQSLFDESSRFDLREKQISIIKGDNVGQKIDHGFDLSVHL